MISRPRLTRGPRGLVLFGFLMALGAISGPASSQTQEKNFALTFSRESGKAEETRNLLLRPNVAQDFFIHVENRNNQTAKLEVEIQANGKTIAGGVWSDEVKAKEKKLVIFGKPAVPAPPAVP